jgi:hypothetical protein
VCVCLKRKRERERGTTGTKQKKVKEGEKTSLSDEGEEESDEAEAKRGSSEEREEAHSVQPVRVPFARRGRGSDDRPRLLRRMDQERKEAVLLLGQFISVRVCVASWANGTAQDAAAVRRERERAIEKEPDRDDRYSDIRLSLPHTSLFPTCTYLHTIYIPQRGGTWHVD